MALWRCWNTRAVGRQDFLPSMSRLGVHGDIRRVFRGGFLQQSPEIVQAKPFELAAEDKADKEIGPRVEAVREVKEDDEGLSRPMAEIIMLLRPNQNHSKCVGNMEEKVAARDGDGERSEAIGRALLRG